MKVFSVRKVAKLDEQVNSVVEKNLGKVGSSRKFKGCTWYEMLTSYKKNELICSVVIREIIFHYNLSDKENEMK